jgi:hypothetical protein
LGSTKSDDLGAYEEFSAAAPFVIRVMTATVDAPGSLAEFGTTGFTSVSVYVTLPEGLSIAAKRLDGDRLNDLEQIGAGRFRDAFPSDCLKVMCARTYVLAACWTEPSAGGTMSVFMGASIVAAPARTSPQSVALSPSPDLLPNEMAIDLAKATGCEGHA